MSGEDERAETLEPAHDLGERITFALRQGAVIAVVLFVIGRLAEGNRPDAAPARNIVTAPVLWAVVAWFVLLLFNAAAFERSKMQRLEGVPLLGALGVSVTTFIVGAATYDAGSTGERLTYLILNSIVVALFWWAIISIAYLLWIRVGDSDLAHRQV